MRQRNVSLFAAAILTGGRSSRMGQDKATLLWNGEALWRHQKQVLEKAGFTDLWLSCRKEQEALFRGEIAMVYDSEQQTGPLSGIGNVLRASAKHTFILGIDMPFVNTELIEPLLEASEGGRYSVVYQQESEAYVEPLCALYSSSALPLLSEMEARDEKRLQSLWRLLVERKLAKVLIPSRKLTPYFENLNSIEQWKRHANPSLP